LKGFKEREGNRVLGGEREKDGWVMQRESVCRDLMVHEWPENQGVYGRVYFDPSWRENILHAVQHYTRYGINYRLGVMKKKILVSNIPLIMSVG